jgi:hypothetical protein
VQLDKPEEVTRLLLDFLDADVMTETGAQKTATDA